MKWSQFFNQYQCFLWSTKLYPAAIYHYYWVDLSLVWWIFKRPSFNTKFCSCGQGSVYQSCKTFAKITKLMDALDRRISSKFMFNLTTAQLWYRNIPLIVYMRRMNYQGDVWSIETVCIEIEISQKHCFDTFNIRIVFNSSHIYLMHHLRILFKKNINELMLICCQLSMKKVLTWHF